MIKYSDSNSAQFKWHSSQNEPIKIQAIVTKPGVWKNVLRPAKLIKDNYRWLKGRPITLNHPSLASEGRATPELAVGQVLEVRLHDGDQVLVDGVIWPEKLPGEILQKINGDNLMGVSTGFFAAEEPTRGAFQGQQYHSVETSLFFDHVAIVPLGACSVKDGCYLKRHDAAETRLERLERLERLNRQMDRALGRKV